MRVCVDNPETLLNAPPPVFWRCCFPNASSVNAKTTIAGKHGIVFVKCAFNVSVC